MQSSLRSWSSNLEPDLERRPGSNLNRHRPSHDPHHHVHRRAAVSALLDRRPARDPQLEARVARIVERVRRDGDAALLAFARKFDRLTGPIEVDAAEIERGARETPREVRDAIRLAARHIRRVARKQIPRGWSVSPVAGVRIEQRVMPLDRVGCYVPGGRYPLPSSLLMTAIPARVAGVREVVAVCPRIDPVVCARHARRASIGCFGSAARTRSRPWPTAPRRCPGRQDRRSGQRLCRGGEGARRGRLRDRLLRRPERDCRRLGDGTAGLDCRRPDRPGRARPGRPRDPDHAVDAAGQRRRARGRPADARRRPGAGLARRQRRDHRGDESGRGHRALSAPRAGASGLRLGRDRGPAHARRHGLRRRLQRPGLRRLRHRIQPRAADQRRRGRPRRPERRRFRARLDGAADHRGRPAPDWAGRRRPGGRRGAHGARRLDGHPARARAPPPQPRGSQP